MIVKTAIAEGHKADPEGQLRILLQRLYKDFPIEQVEEVLFQSALAVAGSCDCLVKIEEAPNKTDSTFYFWSESLGDEYPTDKADPAPISGEPLNEEGTEAEATPPEGS